MYSKSSKVFRHGGARYRGSEATVSRGTSSDAVVLDVLKSSGIQFINVVTSFEERIKNALFPSRRGMMWLFISSMVRTIIPTLLTVITYAVMLGIDKHTHISLENYGDTLNQLGFPLLSFLIATFLGRIMDSNTDIVGKIAEFIAHMRIVATIEVSQELCNNYIRMLTIALEHVANPVLERQIRAQGQGLNKIQNSLVDLDWTVREIRSLSKEGEMRDHIHEAQKLIHTIANTSNLSHQERQRSLLRFLTYIVIGILYAIAAYEKHDSYTILMVYIFAFLYEFVFVVSTDINDFSNVNRTETVIVRNSMYAAQEYIALTYQKFVLKEGDGRDNDQELEISDLLQQPRK